MVVFPPPIVLFVLPGAWIGGALLFTAAAVSLRQQQSVGSTTTTQQSNVVDRPALVTEALQNQEDDQPQQVMYYFGHGSNMLRSKIENRGINGTKIDIIEMEPAVVPNHRLSFRMRGFVPLEPGMGSLEPVDVHDNNDKNEKKNCAKSRLFQYSQPECHGALVTLTPDNYLKVMASEGVGPNSTNPGYEEIVVTAVPYNTSKQPVQAIALRARSHVRLPYDPCPSARYLSILQQGAAELQLRPQYQTFLQHYPVQKTPNWLKRIATYNLLFMLTVSTKLKWRGLSRFQSYVLSYWIYVPSTAPLWQCWCSHILMGSFLFPGACCGVLYQQFLHITKRPMSPMMQRFMTMLQENSNTTQASTTTTAVTQSSSKE